MHTDILKSVTDNILFFFFHNIKAMVHFDHCNDYMKYNQLLLVHSLCYLYPFLPLTLVMMT